MNIRNKDLNLLVIFDTLMNERNVSRAAKRLNLSQPALSNALARLRRDFEDPLFVRAGKGMVPTPRALAVQDDVAGVLGGAEHLYRTNPFAPASLTSRFAIGVAHTHIEESSARLAAPNDPTRRQRPLVPRSQASISP